MAIITKKKKNNDSYLERDAYSVFDFGNQM